MMNPEYKEDRIRAATEIIASIDHWLDNWTKGNIQSEVGSLIQRTAMRELAFMEYLDKKWIPMDELRSMANDQLLRLGESAITVPKPLMILPGKIVPYPFPFPKFSEIVEFTKPTRREELEAMTFGEISVLHKAVLTDKRDKARKAENDRRKENRINAILKYEGVE